MKKILLLCALMVSASMTCVGQTAKEVLDKCAEVVGAKGGIKASFTMESAQYGNTSGTIEIKGKKFHAATPQATMWFDGTTQWTYLQHNNEVSVITPTESQLQALNPYNFINMYKQGFKTTMSKNATAYIVHLTAKDAKHKIQEIFVTIEKKNYHPSEIKMLQGQKWTTFHVTDLKTTKLDDSVFFFNSNDFPTAEVIDLR